MSRQNLTDRFITSRKPAQPGRRDDYPDAIVPGLALRVTDRGHKSFVLVARFPKTAYRRAGLAYQKWHKHFEQADDGVLVVYGPRTVFNPLLPQAVIDAALARDPEAAAAEWLSEWRSDLSDFLDRALIEDAVDRGVIDRPPQPAVQYFSFCDPSDGRGDSFTASVAHVENKTKLVVQDCLYERRAPFDPSTVVAEIAELLRSYRCRETTGDKYAAQWVVEAFKKEWINYQQSERDRSAVYLDALPLFTSGRARLLDNQRLIHQFASLERRTFRLGKDRVDHGPNGAVMLRIPPQAPWSWPHPSPDRSEFRIALWRPRGARGGRCLPWAAPEIGSDPREPGPGEARRIAMEPAGRDDHAPVDRVPCRADPLICALSAVSFPAGVSRLTGRRLRIAAWALRSSSVELGPKRGDKSLAVPPAPSNAAGTPKANRAGGQRGPAVRP